MRRKTRGAELGAFGLSLIAALGLLAIGSATASAKSSWDVEGSPLSGSKTIIGEGGEGYLLVKSLFLEIHCASLALSSGKIYNTDEALAELRFKGCAIKNNLFCKLYKTSMDMELNVNPGEIAAKGKGKLVEHSGKFYFLIEEDDAPLSTIYFSPGSKGCTLWLENTVTGNPVMELPDAGISQQTHLIKPISGMEALLLFSNASSFGSESAEIHGSLITVELASGESWQAL